MEKIKYVAVILVYRNISDLEECVISMKSKLLSVKIIVVNSYYDDESMREIKKVAERLDCYFINVENKGYSYGNNVGIEFARKNYTFDYIIIANPDTVIVNFSDSKTMYDLIAPQITTATGKQQNPMLVKRNKFSEYCIYQGIKTNKRIIFLFGVALNRLQRELAIRNPFRKAPYEIYQAHGSFMLISAKAVEKLFPVFDENMFLYGEESVLAYRMKKMKITAYYTKDIKIFHKEDGSMKLADFSTNKELKKSNIYYYEQYARNK